MKQADLMDTSSLDCRTRFRLHALDLERPAEGSPTVWERARAALGALVTSALESLQVAFERWQVSRRRSGV